MNIIVPADKNKPCYCIFYCAFVILIQLIGTYVSSDVFNIITLITTKHHCDTYHVLVRPT